MERMAQKRVDAVKAETDKLTNLLESNTALTRQDKELTEQVADLTRQIHDLLTAR
jgi:polyhydroxyalkanoate synthesis regulator phasin